jgi:hypothetical protein
MSRAKYEWQDFYESALRETDWQELPGRMLMAWASIRNRKEARTPLDAGEQQAITDALGALAGLRRRLTQDQ